MSSNATATRYIQLSRGGFSVRLGGNFYRPLPFLIVPSETQVGRNADNTPIGYGPRIAGPYQLEFTAQLTTDEYDQLQGCKLDSELARETYQDFGIQVDCTFQTVRERSPRTRPIAAGSETTIGAMVKYFPRFKMAITSWEVTQLWETTQFEAVVKVRLEELDKHAP